MTVTTTQRIVGLDLARAFAIFGMIFVNYKNAMEAGEGAPAWLIWILTRFEGRASIVFVTLAGMGIILLSQKARTSGQAGDRASARHRVLRRSLFILVLGVLNFQIWPGDILHFYGFYLAAGGLLLFVRPSRLWGVVAIVLMVSFALPLRFDQSLGYGSDPYWYGDYLTPRGFVRNTFFNGFHPFFPWVAYVFIGMWFAQLPYNDPSKRRRYLAASIPVALGGEIAMRLITLHLQVVPDEIQEGAVWLAIVPVNMAAGSATAISVILISLMIAERWRESCVVRAFASTGRMALTHYLAHTTLVLGPMYLLGYLDVPYTRLFSVWMSLGFFAAAVTFSVLWSKRYKQGPLEYIMRRVAD